MNSSNNTVLHTLLRNKQGRVWSLLAKYNILWSLASSRQLIVTYLEQFRYKASEGWTFQCQCVNMTVSRSQPMSVCLSF